MRRDLHWSVQLALLLGLVGVFVMSVSFWVGASMVLVGLVVAVVALRGTRKMPSLPSRPKPRTAPTTGHRTVSSQAPVPARRPVDRRKLGVLRYILHQANLDSHATVFQTDEGKAVTVSDILAEMIDIAEVHGRSVEELARDIAEMYPRIFDHAKLAFRQYPDEELAKTYIARKTMTDVRWELDSE